MGAVRQAIGVIILGLVGAVVAAPTRLRVPRWSRNVGWVLLGLAEPTTAALLGVLVRGEALAPLQFGGVLLVLGGVVVVAGTGRTPLGVEPAG